MTIIDKLKSTIELSGVPFIYGTPKDLNHAMDMADFDTNCIYAYCPVVQSATLTNTDGVYREKINVLVSFVTETKHDPHMIENEQLITDCKAAAIKWLYSLNGRAQFRVDTIQSTQRVYDAQDRILTGFALSVSLVETNGISACNYGQ